ncbi:MAG TPA: hypothetical protein VMD98_04835 [Bryocella sp.]|nr:hypothetical protein [Bryocella sp.]
MTKNSAVLEDEAAPAIEPEMLSELKKEDMQQAVVERFKLGIHPRTKDTSGKERRARPNWQPSDQEC